MLPTVGRIAEARADLSHYKGIEEKNMNICGLYEYFSQIVTWHSAISEFCVCDNSRFSRDYDTLPDFTLCELLKTEIPDVEAREVTPYQNVPYEFSSTN